MGGRVLGGYHEVLVRIDRGHLLQVACLTTAAGRQVQTVLHFVALAVEAQQTNAMSEGRTDNSAIVAKARLLDESPSHVGLLHVIY